MIKYDKDFCIHSKDCRYLTKGVEEEMGNRPIYVSDFRETDECKENKR